MVDLELTDELESIEDDEAGTKSIIRKLLESSIEGLDEEVTTKEISAKEERKSIDALMLHYKLKINNANATGKEIPINTRHFLFLLNKEYTRRGIAPVFRNIPGINEDDQDSIADIFFIDLEWLTERYKNHKTFFSRWNGLFKPATFVSTAEWIMKNYPQRALHWIVRGLSLTSDQQTELNFIKRAQFANELKDINGELGESAKNSIAMKYHAIAKNSSHRSKDPKTAIERRFNIWYCGTLARWSPQRTATFYTMRTGETIGRDTARYVIQQVHRDVPNSKPKRKQTAE